MKQFILRSTTFLCVFSLIVTISSCTKNVKTNTDSIVDKLSKEENMKEAMDHEIDRTMDPELGTVPYERLQVAQRYYAKMKMVKGKTSSPFADIQWAERGPNDVGGRTRAILFLSATKVLAAGATGGLWLTEDITASPPTWTPIGDFLSKSINISTLAQDSAKPNILYAGTGEAFGSAYLGSGIYKSTDTGSTWTHLSATSYSSSTQNFAFVAKIIVTKNSDVYAACKFYNSCNRGGLMRSTNGGTSWTRVVGTYTSGGCTAAVDFVGADLERNPDGDIYYATGNSGYPGHILVSKKSVHGANVGNSGNWTDITPSGSWERIEIGVSQQSGSGVIYAACEGNGSNNVTGVFSSSDKGSNWTSRSVPTICDQGSNSGTGAYTRNQAWYDQVVQIDPTDDATLYLGGIDIVKSTDSGATFNQITTWSTYWSAGGCSGSVPPKIHADQHALVFNPFTTNAALSGNDGGLFYSTTMNSTTPSWSDKNDGYNVTQFYHLATHPTDGDYLLGGTQDNGSWKLTDSGVTGGIYASGGDGAYCHINQSNANYQLTSYVYNNYYNTINGGTTDFVKHGTTQDNTNTNTGRFINPTDLDDVSYKLFSAGSGDYLEVRSGLNSSTFARSTYNLSFNSNQLTALKVSPNNDSLLYVGDDDGYVYKIDNRDGTPTLSQTWQLSSAGYISSIDVWKSASGDDDSLLVTLSSYGVNSVYVTGNGTVASPTFTDIDDNSTLQDMPVRWGIFSNEGPDKIFIATDLGVLGTETITGNTTAWTMINNDILPSVRVDALEYDADDNLVAATHGRGIWETTKPLCNASNPILPTASGTYTSTKVFQDGTNTCFCDADDNLLLVLDTNGSGAVIPTNGVGLKIGTNKTITHTGSGGIFTNPDGAVIIDRKWDVSATTPPTGTVKVRTYFTDEEYDSVVNVLGNLTSPTTITNPNQLGVYKLTNGGSYADPHASGATGVILAHGSTPSTSIWTYSASGTDHSAEFLVTSFSGGGGGGGGGGGALPVELIQFDAIPLAGHKAELNWTTASELNNKVFEVERSIDGGVTFIKIGFRTGHGNSNKIKEYDFIDTSIPVLTNKVLYRLNQIDFDGAQTLSDIRMVKFDANRAILNIYPNPACDILNVNVNRDIIELKIYNMSGIEMPILKSGFEKLDVSSYPTGVYFMDLETASGKKISKFSIYR